MRKKVNGDGGGDTRASEKGWGGDSGVGGDEEERWRLG